MGILCVCLHSVCIEYIYSIYVCNIYIARVCVYMDSTCVCVCVSLIRTHGRGNIFYWTSKIFAQIFPELPAFGHKRPCCGIGAKLVKVLLGRNESSYFLGFPRGDRRWKAPLGRHFVAGEESLSSPLCITYSVYVLCVGVLCMCVGSTCVYSKCVYICHMCAFLGY